MARLAIYLRRSSPGEEDKNYSLENQREDIEKRWSDFPQHEVFKTYTDPGGKSYTLNRPVLQQMMTDAKAGLFDIVVVGRWDRFSRVQDQQAVAIYQFEQYGVKVVSATQPVPDGPIGTLIRGNYAFAAELELQNIRERTYAGKSRGYTTANCRPSPIRSTATSSRTGRRKFGTFWTRKPIGLSGVSTRSACRACQPSR